MAKYNTHQKNQLFCFLHSNSNTAFTVDEITDKLAELNKKPPAKSTVYRLIGELVEDGAVKRFVRGNSRQFLYQSMDCAECRSHLHMKCVSCGKLLHMEPELSKKLLNDILGEDSFLVECDKTTLFGCCRECAEKKKSENKKND